MILGARSCLCSAECELVCHYHFDSDVVLLFRVETVIRVERRSVTINGAWYGEGIPSWELWPRQEVIKLP